MRNATRRWSAYPSPFITTPPRARGTRRHEPRSRGTDRSSHMQAKGGRRRRGPAAAADWLTAASRSPACMNSTPAAASAGAISSAASPMRYDAIAQTKGSSERRVRLVLAAATEDHVQPHAGKGGERAKRGSDVRRLGVVHEAHTVELPNELDPVRDSLERRERVRDRVVFDPSRPRGRGRCRGILAVVRAREFAARPAGRRRLQTRPVARRPEPRGNDRGTTAASSLDWRSKIRSLRSA